MAGIPVCGKVSVVLELGEKSTSELIVGVVPLDAFTGGWRDPLETV
jgi:hypothetical protein